MFVIAEIKAITNDDMVEEMDAHGVASLLDTLRQAKKHFTDLTDAWQARSDAGEFDGLSGREYENLWASAVLDFVSAYVPKTRTLNDSHTVTIKLSPDENGVYWIDHDSLRQIDVFVIE